MPLSFTFKGNRIMSLVTASVALLNVSTGDYPLYLNNVRRAHPNTSFPQEMSTDQLAELGYAVVQLTPQPQADVVTEGAPQLIDGEYVQHWETREFNEMELAEQLSQRKSTLLAGVAELYEQALLSGMQYTTSDEVSFHVQIRDVDRTNLLCLLKEAETLIENGVTELQEFRCRDNITRLLEPLELANMCTECLQFVKALYRASWALKDQITTATTLAELPEMPDTLVD